MLEGIGGTLLAGSFVAERLSGVLHDQGTGMSRFPSRLRAWCRASQACGPASSVRALTDAALRPLLALLGVEVVQPAPLSEEMWRATLRAGEVRLPAVITVWGRSLESTWRDATRIGLAGGTRWCVLFNGTHLRVLDISASGSRRHLNLHLEAVADHERSAQAAWLLLARACFAAAPGASASDGLLGHVVAVADREGAEQVVGLQHGVREAIEHLTGGVLGVAGRRRPESLTAAYQQALTAAYRMLFLLFAEARGLVPSWHAVYRESYTIEALRGAAEAAAETPGLWEAFQAMSRLAHAGCEAGDLRVTAFNGRLFAPHRAPLLETRALPDDVMRSAVRALSSVATPRGRERISYRDLGVEQLGAVYETLLEYEPAERRAQRHGGPVVLVRTGPQRRKTSGTFYTPEPITRYLVRHALDSLTAGANPEQVLSLRVADPAMGSGAFLVAACRYLADAYESALVREGRCLASDISERDRAGFRRLVSQRCLFGVDANPMAVHLARLSLWLSTLAADRPLGFLDHHLLTGDSLLGITPAHVASRPPSVHRGARSDDRQLPLFDLADLHLSVRGALPVRERLERDPEDTAADVRGKEAALERLAATGELRKWREVCDLWCAVFLRLDRMSPALFAALVDQVLQRHQTLPAPVAEGALAPARQLASDLGLLHWPLEWPEVFCDEQGRERPDGGFDAVVGNPPWEMVRADAGRLHGGERAVTRFTRRAGMYYAQSDGHPNLYQVFLERAVQLTRPGGRLALVLPHGLASDQGAARLRHLLLHRCTTDRIVGFGNRGGVFPIHRSVRFLLLTATRGGQTTSVRCRFGLQDPDVLDSLSEDEQAHRETAFPVRLTPALLERLSGPGLAIPELRDSMDLQIAERLAVIHPRISAPEGWGARFGRELNASDDRDHFTVTAGGLRVVDGKHLAPFTILLPAAPRYVTAASARKLLPRGDYRRERLAFRDVTSATNRTTLIAALVPAGCITTHTVFCLRTPLNRADQLLLCALLNSYVANYLVRMRVSSHVTLAILETLPVPRLDPAYGVGAELVRLARALTDRRNTGTEEPRLQGLTAFAYGLTHGELAHVLTTFPLVPADHRTAALRAFTAACRT